MKVTDVLCLEPAYCDSWEEWIEQVLDDRDEFDRVCRIADDVERYGQREPVRYDPDESQIGNGMHRVAASVLFCWDDLMCEPWPDVEDESYRLVDFTSTIVEDYDAFDDPNSPWSIAMSNLSLRVEDFWAECDSAHQNPDGFEVFGLCGIPEGGEDATLAAINELWASRGFVHRLVSWKPVVMDW